MEGGNRQIKRWVHILHCGKLDDLKLAGLFSELEIYSEPTSLVCLMKGCGFIDAAT